MSKLDDQIKEWNDPVFPRTFSEAEDLIDSLLARVANLEAWNREMYENHKAEIVKIKVNMANAGDTDE